MWKKRKGKGKRYGPSGWWLKGFFLFVKCMKNKKNYKKHK